MKQILKSFIITILMSSATIVNAQKIGHIDLQALVKDMPEMKKAEDSLIAIQTQWQNLLKETQTELEKKYMEIQAKKSTWPSSILKQKETELEEGSQKFEATKQTAQEDLQEKQSSLQEPVLEKAKLVINQVAKELGYNTVINSSGGFTLIVSSPADDLMSAVKKKMGIVEKPVAPAGAPKFQPKQ